MVGGKLGYCATGAGGGIDAVAVMAGWDNMQVGQDDEFHGALPKVSCRTLPARREAGHIVRHAP